MGRRLGGTIGYTRCARLWSQVAAPPGSREGGLQRQKANVEAFAAVAAHELLAALVITEAYAATVSERLDEERHADSPRDLETLGRGAARMRQLVEALLHARAPAGAGCGGAPST